MAEIEIEEPVVVVTAPHRLPFRLQIGVAHLAFAHNFLWPSLLLFTIPAQVATIAGEKNKDSALAGVLVAGALVGALTQVVGGALSDRATFRLGRRRPFIVGGTAIALAGLLLMSTARSIPMLAGSFLLLQFGYNIGQAAYAALLPDIVPRRQRGSVSGLLGLMALLGTVLAALIAGKVVTVGNYASFREVYLMVVAVMALFTVTTALAVHEAPVDDVEPLAMGTFLRSLWVNPRAYPDFAWVFVTRFLVMMGYFTVLDFLFYFVRDALGRHNPGPVVSLITDAVVAGSLITIFTAGRYSDRVGRKPIVYASAGFMAVVSLAFIVTRSVGLAVVVAALWGLGWGAYSSVDWALATDVLPQPASAAESTSFARCMGIWSLAITVPQVLSSAIGPLIDAANQRAAHSGYTLMFCFVFVYFLFGAILVRNIRMAA